MIIAKYKFNSTLYADLIPEFNAEFTNYTVTDEITETDGEGNVIVTRVIEHDTLLPTLMRFGVATSNEPTNRELSLLEVIELNATELTYCSRMFVGCQNVTSINTEGWTLEKVTNMYAMFSSCNNLTSLDVSNFDTSNVTNMAYMFYNCNKLTSLDVSNFDTSKVTNFIDIFTNTPLLTDIGMLYCTPSTINALSSNISTPSTNVWVEGSMIDDLTSYDNVTYKAYYWEKEILLNSPLLEGDKIVKKEGKIYHYHKMGMVVLDGSEDEEWGRSSDVDTEDTKRYSLVNLSNIKKSGFIICDNIGTSPNYTEIFLHNVVGRIDIRHYYLIDSRWSDISSLKQWLQQNPTTVVYELANPYYELISDTSDDLSLPLVSEDNIISNNSLIPTNMNVKNNGMSTVAMQSSTKYTVAFDKDADSSVTIDLCGSTIDTTDNVVEITTPSELANDEITFIGDCEVSNVRILDGSVSGDCVPRESFEGLKSSFEDGLITDESDEHYGKYKVEYKVSKEDGTVGYIKTFYLNSPLLEGDTIEDVNGVATHVKRYDKVVLDGNETWQVRNVNSLTLEGYYYTTTKLQNIICDKFKKDSVGDIERISFDSGSYIYLYISKSKLSSIDLVGFKQWLSENPTTVVYELVSPIYETISEDSILCDSYVNGHLDVDTNVPIEKVEFKYKPIPMSYVTLSTNYIIQFHANNEGKLNNILFDGNSYGLNALVTKGINKFTITSKPVKGNGLIALVGIGFNASNIQVIATDRDNIGYFKGIESSFEGNIVTDETDENYGRYEVEVILENEDGLVNIETIYLNSPLLKGDRIEMYNGKLCHYHKMGIREYQEGDLDNYITDLVNTVYELVEPYYEEITPQQNEFTIVSIGESSFTIDSGAIPTNGEVTYNVNIKLLNDLEENINNNTSSTETDLATILDDIINE